MNIIQKYIEQNRVRKEFEEELLGYLNKGVSNNVIDQDILSNTIRPIFKEFKILGYSFGSLTESNNYTFEEIRQNLEFYIPSGGVYITAIGVVEVYSLDSSIKSRQYILE